MKKKLLLLFVVVFCFKYTQEEEQKENYIKFITNTINNCIENIKIKYPKFYEKEGQFFSKIAEDIKKLSEKKIIKEKQEIIYDLIVKFKEKIKSLIPEQDLVEINLAIEFIKHFFNTKKNNQYPDKSRSEENPNSQSHQKDYNKNPQNELKSDIDNPYSINSNAIDKKMFIIFIVFIILLCLFGSYIIAKRRVKQANIENIDISPHTEDSEVNLEIPKMSSIIEKSFIPKNYINVTQLSNEQKLDE